MEQVSLALEPIRSFLFQLGEFLPKLMITAVVLVVGWLLAKFLRFALIKGLKLVNFGLVTHGLDRFLKQGGIKKTTTDILGILIYWLVILATLLVASNTLGLSEVSVLVSQLTRFIPRVIVGVLILAIGLYFARFVSEALFAYGKNVGIENVDLISRAAHYAIVVFVILIALDQVQVGGDLIRQSFLILFGGIVLALALAFGLGGRDWAAAQLEKITKTRRKPKS